MVFSDHTPDVCIAVCAGARFNPLGDIVPDARGHHRLMALAKALDEFPDAVGFIVGGDENPDGTSSGSIYLLDFEVALPRHSGRVQTPTVFFRPSVDNLPIVAELVLRRVAKPKAKIVTRFCTYATHGRWLAHTWRALGFEQIGSQLSGEQEPTSALQDLVLDKTTRRDPFWNTTIPGLFCRQYMRWTAGDYLRELYRSKSGS